MLTSDSFSMRGKGRYDKQVFVDLKLSKLLEREFPDSVYGLGSGGSADCSDYGISLLIKTNSKEHYESIKNILEKYNCKIHDY